MTQTKAQLLDGKSATIQCTGGSASAPAISFTGDTNTGIYSPGADQVAISTNGTQAVVVNSTGRIGIGGNGTGTNLGVYLQNGGGASAHFYEASDGTKKMIAGVDSGQDFVKIGTLSNHPLGFVTNNGEKLRITTDGKVGLGTSTVSRTLDVVGTGIYTAYTGNTGATFNIVPGANGQDGVSLVHSYQTGTGYGPLKFEINGEKMRLDASGRLGVGTTGPAGQLQVNGQDIYLTSNGTVTDNRIRFSNFNFTGNSVGAALGYTYRIANTQESGNLVFYTNPNSDGTGSLTERARIDSSGRLLVGTSTVPSSINSQIQFVVEQANNYTTAVLATNQNSSNGAYLTFQKSRSTSANGNTVVQNNDELGVILFAGTDGALKQPGAQIAAYVDDTPGANDMPGRLVFSTTANGTSSVAERMRIQNDGKILFGKTSDNFGSDGLALRPGGDDHWTKTNVNIVAFRRNGSDGQLIQFYQDGNQEGDISVSGTTVSYNGAHLSRWSQLQKGAERTEILRGSVLSNIDEMCEWGDEENEQLNRMKVSDVEGDKNVAGVFQAWDDDDDTYTNDFYCAMTGDFIIRIGAGVTVERGDLLMSAGDGTAKPQDDDIIRSKTIAKVTSTNVSCTYSDGSYCVPCVLMAC